MAKTSEHHYTEVDFSKLVLSSLYIIRDIENTRKVLKGQCGFFKKKKILFAKSHEVFK